VIEPSPSATLESALRSEGFDSSVVAEGRLAVIVPRAASGATAALRARAWPLARAAGFTHAAIELLDQPPSDAPVRFD
jgi:hypothetical protein